jgi:predicted TIM-barrel fold metal-dependent hydrolase
MIIDSNAYLGHWPFRRLRYNTGAGLVQLMDRAGIDRACVSSASAIMYKNSHAGNGELAEEIEGRRDRLTPFAVLNPAYAAWERDLHWCHAVLGAKGLRLYPAYHLYTLDDTCCHEIVEAATELGMLISIPVRAADPRQRHWLIDVGDVPLADIAGLAAAHPEARFIILEGDQFTRSPLIAEADQLPPNYWLEMSRPYPLYNRELQKMKDALGADRIVFGTGICFKYPEPALLRMEVLQASDDEKELIYSGNMVRLLGE